MITRISVISLLVLLTCTLTTVTAWSCDIMPSPVDGRISRISGGSTMLRCMADDAAFADAAEVVWYAKKGDAFVPIGNNTGLSVRSSPGGRLMFVLTALEDANNYKCEVTINGETQSCDVELVVNEAIEFVDAPKKQNPRVGADAEIKCRVSGTPRPDITWTQGAQRQLTSHDIRGYEFRENGQILVIPDYQVKDDGRYICMASQELEGDFKTIQIDVAGHIAPSIETHPSANTTQNQGFSIVYECTGLGTPLPTYSWWKGDTTDGQRLTDTDKYRITDITDERTLVVVGKRLVIVDLMAADMGPYTCQARNKLDTAEFMTFLHVFLKPSITPMSNLVVKENAHVQIPCNYSGDGTLKATWITPTGKALITPGTDDPAPKQHNDNIYPTIDGNNLTLHILNVDINYAGQYTCQVENEAGKVVEHVNLRVEHAPVHIAHSDAPVRAVIGQKTEVFCEAEAVPLVDWEWSGPNGAITTGKNFWIDTETPSDTVSRSVLTIQPQMASEFGEYQCRASNEKGNDSWYTEIVLVETPEVPTGILTNGSHPTFVIIHVNSYMNMGAGSSKQPVEVEFRYTDMDMKMSEDFDWTLDGTPIKLGYVATSTYTIHQMLPNTEYVIQVRGVNEAGESEWSEEVPYSTSDPRVPNAPVFMVPDENFEPCNELCRIEWTAPISNGGMEITGYRVEYAPMSDDRTLDGAFVGYRDPLPAHQQSINMQQLRPSTYYTIRIYALNGIGQSEPAELIVITPNNLLQVAGISAGMVVLIVIIVLFVICAVIDVCCYFLNQCGFIMFVCINCCGREHPENMKQRDMHQLEEANNVDDKQPLNRVAVGAVDEKEPLETTPLNGADNALTGKATTV